MMILNEFDLKFWGYVAYVAMITYFALSKDFKENAPEEVKIVALATAPNVASWLVVTLLPVVMAYVPA